MIPWIKVDAGWMEHPKLIELASRLTNFGDSPHPARDVYVGKLEAAYVVMRLWDFAARHCPNGDLTDKLDLYHMQLGRGSSTRETITEELIGVGLLVEHDGRVFVNGWSDRYGEIIEKIETRKEATRQRVARHRAKKSSRSGNAGETECNAHVTPGNANVTPTERSSNACNALKMLDVDGDELPTDTSANVPLADPPSPKPAKSKWHDDTEKAKQLWLERFAARPSAVKWSQKRTRRVDKAVRRVGLDGLKLVFDHLEASQYHMEGGYYTFDKAPLRDADLVESFLHSPPSGACKHDPPCRKVQTVVTPTSTRDRVAQALGGRQKPAREETSCG